MKKITLYIMFALMMFSGAAFAYAQTDGTPANTPAESPAPAPQGLLQRMRDLITNKKEVRVDARAAVQNVRQDAQAEVKNVRDEIASSTDKRMEINDIREKVASTTQEIRNEAVDARAAIVGEQKDVLVKRIDTRFTTMTARYQATIDRENSIMAKLQSRIEKIKAGGGNTDTADQFVLEAQTHLTEAQTSFNFLQTIVDSTATTTIQTATSTLAVPRGLLDAMKKAGLDIESHLKGAQDVLERAVSSLLGPSAHNATTTTQ